MIRWIVIFLIIALVAAIFGFGGIADGAAEIAKIIFYIFIYFTVSLSITVSYLLTVSFFHFFFWFTTLLSVFPA